jgi:hypothetical protein
MCVLVVGLFVSGTVNAQRVACNNFAELAVSVVQIRQKESQVQRVLDYAEKNLKGEYNNHIFILVKDMILAAYERPVSCKQRSPSRGSELCSEPTRDLQ